MSNVTIGELIKRRVDEIGISKAEVARRMNMSRANVHKVFGRKTLDIEMLRRFGIVLRYDFISHYHYLMANAIPGMRLASAAAHEPSAFYMQSLYKKIVHVLKASREVMVREPFKPTDHLVTDIDLIQGILHDMIANYASKGPGL